MPGGNISAPPPHHRDTNSKYDDRHCSDTEDMSTLSRQTDCTHDKGVVYEHDKGEDEIPFEDPRPRLNTSAEKPSNFNESNILSKIEAKNENAPHYNKNNSKPFSNTNMSTKCGKLVKTCQVH